MLFLCLLATITTAGSYKQQTVPSIEVSGIVKLQEVNVQGCAQIIGSLYAIYGTISSFDVSGEVRITDVTVLKPSHLIGAIQASRSHFQELLTLFTPKALFTSCSIHSILFQKDSAFRGKQILELRQKTIVEGPVTFESGTGEVHLYSGSQVLGPVHGGKIIKK